MLADLEQRFGPLEKDMAQDSIGSDFADSYGSLPGESPANSGVFEPPVPAATGDMGAAVTASGTAAASLIYGQQFAPQTSATRQHRRQKSQDEILMEREEYDLQLAIAMSRSSSGGGYNASTGPPTTTGSGDSTGSGARDIGHTGAAGASSMAAGEFLSTSVDACRGSPRLGGSMSPLSQSTPCADAMAPLSMHQATRSPAAPHSSSTASTSLSPSVSTPLSPSMYMQQHQQQPHPSDAYIAQVNANQQQRQQRLERFQEEQQSKHYMVQGVTPFDVALQDGFFAMHGNFPELMGQAPTLDALRRLKATVAKAERESLSPSSRNSSPVSSPGSASASGTLHREAVVVDHRYDQDIVELENEAAIQVCGAAETPEARIKALAEIVSRRMGGPSTSDEQLSSRWMSDTEQLQSPVRMLGSIRVGLCRHRALLFKVLSDSLSLADDTWKCRLLRMFPGVWVPEVKIRGSVYLVDLMSVPGTLLPSFSDDDQGVDNAGSSAPAPAALAPAPPVPVGADVEAAGAAQEGRATEVDGATDADSGAQGFQLGAAPAAVPNFGDLIDLSESNDDKERIASPSAMDATDHNPELVRPWVPPPCALDVQAGRGRNDVGTAASGDPLSGAFEQSVSLHSGRNSGGDDMGDDDRGDEDERARRATGSSSTEELERSRSTSSELAGSSSSQEREKELTLSPDFPFYIKLEELEFEETSRLGVGSFGEVFKGTWRGTTVAIKRLLAAQSTGDGSSDVPGDVMKEFLTEVSILKKLRHPNVVLFMGVVLEPKLNAIVTEYLHRGSLFKLLHSATADKILNPVRRMQMAVDIAMGMQYLHSMQPVIVHRDLKSPNLLVDKNFTVKVADFGLSRTKRRNAKFLSRQSKNGTLEWMAPEVLRNEKSNEKEDVYSFGVICWEILTSRVPWEELLNPVQVVYAVGVQGRRLIIPEDLDEDMKRVIDSCWQSRPEARPSFSDLLEDLRPKLSALMAEYTKVQRAKAEAVKAAEVQSAMMAQALEKTQASGAATGPDRQTG